jgi:hypothetical protein
MPAFQSCLKFFRKVKTTKDSKCYVKFHGNANGMKRIQEMFKSAEIDQKIKRPAILSHRNEEMPTGSSISSINARGVTGSGPDPGGCAHRPAVATGTIDTEAPS